jgi:hypothetical protein
VNDRMTRQQAEVVWRLYQFALLQWIDNTLHKLHVPGRWWCDAIDRRFWELMGAPLPEDAK